MPFGPRLLESHLRGVAREHIEAGRLPASFPREVYAGYGSGVACELCGRQISRADVEYEVNDARTGARFTLHVVCHAYWQLDLRETRMDRRRPRSSSQPAGTSRELPMRRVPVPRSSRPSVCPALKHGSPVS